MLDCRADQHRSPFLVAVKVRTTIHAKMSKEQAIESARGSEALTHRNDYVHVIQVWLLYTESVEIREVPGTGVIYECASFEIGQQRRNVRSGSNL